MKQIAQSCFAGAAAPFLLFGSVALCPLLDYQPAKAQITEDGTLSTTVNSPDGSNFTIENGDRPEGGGNLFHSFSEFSVPTGGSASFNNAPDVENIINRVTGGSVSDIDGLIRANGSANLFLLNPAGIIFGPNASLNIGGSFFGSTASSLVFPEGEFSATDTQTPPLLTVNGPIGLNLRDNPEDITVSPDNTGQSLANLTVGQGKNISLIGGNVNIDRGLIFAPGGRVNLGGLSVAGEVEINSDGSLTFPDEIERADVFLANGSSVNVSSNNGGSITVNARNFEILGGAAISAGIIPGNQQANARAGDIVINATDKVTIAAEANSTSVIVNVVGDLFGTDFSSTTPTQGNAGNILIDTNELEGTGSFVISSFANGEGNAGNVTITAKQSVSLTGNETGSGIASIVGPSALGNGADITITTPSLSISNGTIITTSTLGQGNAGNIFINATDSISLDNGSQLQAITFSQGNAGNIVINAENADITLNNQSLFSTSVLSLFSKARDQGGDINITASSLSLSNGARLNTSNLGVGNAGGINLTTSNLSLTNGGQLLAITRGQGDAGNVTVNADSILLDGQDNNGFPSGIFSQVGDLNQSVIPTGNAGEIELNTNSLSVNNGAKLSSSTFGKGNAGIITINDAETVSFDRGGLALSTVEATGRGTAGGININTSNLSLTNGGQLLASTRGRGDAGNVTVNADSILLDGQDNTTGFPSAIFSRVGDPNQSVMPVGNAGGIELNTNSLSVNNEATLSTSTFGEGNAGTITINATDTVSFDNSGDAFSTVEATGKGIAGGINLTTSNLSLTNGGQLLAITRGQGDAGNVTVNADSILLDGQDNNGFPSAVFSSVEGGAIGNAGGIDLTAQNLLLNNGSELNTSSFGQGNAGSVRVNTNSLTLDNGSSIIASNTPSELLEGDLVGGNITLEIADNLILRNNSLISAAANNNANGGNIDIDAEFVIAYPSQIPNDGNDIIANAERGRGGNIDINTQQIFGLEERRAIPGNGTNDIDASSEFGLSGEVRITNPDVDISQGALEPPDNVIEPEAVTAQACRAAGRVAKGESSFIITGRGGLPALATDPLNSDQISIEGDDAAQNSQRSSGGVVTVIEQPNPPSSEDIVPARGMIVNEKGEVVLTAYPTPNTSQRTPTSSVSCSRS